MMVGKMAGKDSKKKISFDAENLPSAPGSYGNAPEVDADTLESEGRVITSVEQGIELAQLDITDARRLINAAQRITAKKQGAPPYSPAKLKAQAKGYKRNLSTRFLQKELARAAARFYSPILTASTLTAAELPAGWPNGAAKTKFFRDTITRAIRGWRKNNMFWRGAGTEVCDYGYGFACFPDGPYEWRPTLVRMDRGFVPRGSEVMDDKLGRFTLKYDYRPDELLGIVKKATADGSDNWDKDAVAKAVDHASLPTLPQDMSQLRKWEELIREQSTDFNFSRTQRMIKAQHQWVLEATGKVSHYIYWPDGPSGSQLLFECLDEYENTDQAVIPIVFGYGDGTIQGSCGCGQLLYDLAAQVEKIRCDSMDNLLNSNKARLQVANAKDAAAAQLVVNDTMIIATGATFAQNIGGISGDPKGYMILDDKMTQWAQEVVGTYLPPIPRQGSAAATELAAAAKQQQDDTARDTLEAWLQQVAIIIAEMTRRMLLPESDDPYAQGVRKRLLGDSAGWVGSILNKVKEALRTKIKALEKIIPPPPVSLTEEEIEILVNQPAIQSVTDFTEWAATQRAQFAASVQNNPLFNQAAVAGYMAAGVPNAGAAFVDSIVTPAGDTTSQTAGTRQQIMENNVMLTGVDVPVVVTDPHYVHWQALVQPLNQAIQGGAIPAATVGLKHASAHYASGVAQKTWPPDQINSSKAQLATWQRALEAKQQEIAQAQQAQQRPPLGGVPAAPVPMQPAV